MFKPTRRRFLRAGASLTIGLPWLASLADSARAADDPFPPRVVFVITTCGVVPGQWFPAQTGADFTLPFSTAPLAAYQDRMIVYKGVENASAKSQGGNAHTKAGSHTLTGVRHIDGQFTMAGGGGFATGISIDQQLAADIGGGSPVSSLLTGVEIGLGANGETPRSRFSYLGNNMPVAPLGTPSQVFDRLVDFTGGPGIGEDPAEILRLRAEKRSVLDLAMSDIEQLEASLSAVDRARLDNHLTQLRELEQGIADLPAPDEIDAACAELGDPGAGADFRQDARKMFELIAFALRCDITRVATFQWAGTQSFLRYGFVDGIPTNDGHHYFSHLEGAEYDEPMRRIARWHSQQTAYLAELLDAIPEGEGTALDNTIIVHLNTLNQGQTHNYSNMPLLTIGGTNRLNVGRSHDFGDRSLNDFFITLAQAVGVDMATFGDPQHVQGVLPGVLA